MNIWPIGIHEHNARGCIGLFAFDPVRAEAGIEVGAVNVDFSANLGEGDDALVAVVLPCFGRDSEQLSRGFGFQPFGIAVGSVAVFNHLREAVELVVE